MMKKKIRSGHIEKSVDMQKQIVDLLKDSLNTKIVEDLVSSYKAVKEDFVKGQYETSISKSGIFVENVLRFLHYILTNQELLEIKPNKNEEIKKKLMQADSSKYSDRIRILIPVACDLIYQTRSKSGAVHVKPISPDYIDSKLVVSACDWIVAELLRTYYKRDEQVVNDLIKDIVKDYIPIIQRIGTENFVTINIDCEAEILIHLCVSNQGLTRKEIGVLLKNHSPSMITQALHKMKNKKKIFFTESKKYYINERTKPEVIKKYFLPYG